MDKTFFIFNYLKYRRLKTNEHGIHSPFVFDLYNSVINNNTDYYAYPVIEAVRGEMLADKRIINIRDLGAGSVTGSSRKKSVHTIAATAAKQEKYGKLLFRLANHFQPKTILEIGTSLGLGTMYLAIARSETDVITLEGCPETRKIAVQNFNTADLHNIRSVEGNFDDTLPEVLTEINHLDLVFFDGNHRKEPTLRYFEQCLQKATNESVFIFDDIYWSKEMTEAWNVIKSHPDVTVTIDLFQMGIVFFRKEQAKQHFVLSF